MGIGTLIVIIRIITGIKVINLISTYLFGTRPTSIENLTVIIIMLSVDRCESANMIR